jgi:thiol-disulfide isomerase/thioredoxin
LRTGPNDVKTVASVGDRPLPVRTGPPESSVRSGEPEPIVASSSGRVSGRVYDDQGKPVAGARVRLAVGAERGGKALATTTDRSGAFTLRGLRPGSSYTLIAEYEGRSGLMTGRAEAEAPESNVRIGLQRARSEDESTASIRPARPNVEPVSNLEEAEEADEGQPAPRFNQEDIDPPAPEADEVDKAAAAEPRSAVARGNARTRGGSGWTQARGSAPATRPQRTPEPQEPENEEQNPLPPAIGSDQAGSTSGPGPEADRSVRLARSGDRSEGSSPQPLPGGVIAGARRVSPDSYGPIQMPESDEAVAPTADAPPRKPASRATARSPRRASPPASPDQPRPTWGELSFMTPGIPLDESLQRASRDLSVKAMPATAAAPPASAPAAGVDSLLKSAATGPACQFDPAQRLLEDFVLPDAQGRMVSFRSFDSDLILLDFWGTWCAPCRKSVAHLVEIQQKLGGKKMQVIGIACEKSQPKEWSAKVAQAIQRLGINYPVLISTMDGTCPVQDAFQIQFYPTLVLLDRQGRILWREQGATDVTLARMDRFIARNLRLGRGREVEREPAQMARARD